MLRAPLALVLVVGFSLLGTEVQRRLQARGIRLPAIEGVFWILMGFSLGSRGLGLLPSDILAKLHPVVLLALAWVGLAFGMQVEFRVLRRLEPWHRRLGLSFPLLTGLLVALVCLKISSKMLPAFGLGAVAMLSAPESLEALSRARKPASRAAIRLLRLLTAFSGIPAVLSFGVASVLFSPLSTVVGGDLSWTSLLLEVGGIGLVAGYAILVMVRGVSDHISIMTILIGVAALVAGATSTIGISPLPAAALTGAIVINRCIFPHRILRAVHLFERPLLIALMVLVGAALKGLAFSWWVFLVLAFLRPAALVAQARLLGRLMTRRGLPPGTKGLGFGLLPQGALSIALIIALMSLIDPIRGFLEAAAAALVVNQLMGEIWLRRFLFPRTGAK